MLAKHSKNRFGFTLVELLIVIAIIGILSTAAVVNLGNAKAKARDAKRLSDISQLQKAIELYYAEHEAYPNSDCYGLPGVVLCSSVRGNNWISNIGPGTQLNVQLPVDPINLDNGGLYSYLYTRQVQWADQYYYLVYKLETMPQRSECNGSTPYTGWSCRGGGDMP